MNQEEQIPEEFLGPKILIRFKANNEIESVKGNLMYTHNHTHTVHVAADGKIHQISGDNIIDVIHDFEERNYIQAKDIHESVERGKTQFLEQLKDKDGVEST